jgi:biotin carboxyl carrier protein
MNFSFWLRQKEFKVNVEEKARSIFRAAVDERCFDVGVEFIGPDELLLNIDGKIFNVTVNSNSLSHSVFVNGRLFRIEKRSALKILKEEKGRPKKKDIKITMPGRVVQILAAEGDDVEEGQAVLVLEAMKMQNEIKSPQVGRIIRMNFKAGDYVESGSTLFSVE